MEFSKSKKGALDFQYIIIIIIISLLFLFLIFWYTGLGKSIGNIINSMFT